MGGVVATPHRAQNPPMMRISVIALVATLGGCSQQERLVEERSLPAQEELMPPAQPCLVTNASDCLAMDERPFAFCALGDERCAGEAEFQYVKP